MFASLIQVSRVNNEKYVYLNGYRSIPNSKRKTNKKTALNNSQTNRKKNYNNTNKNAIEQKTKKTNLNQDKIKCDKTNY